MEKIMIIDSDFRQMRELNDGLNRDYQILNCSRGSKAMELFTLYQPSALLLDPVTRELDGKAFLRQIRSLPKGGRLPILAFTQINTLRHIEDSFHWGVDAIFSKPCSAERARKKLEECLGRVVRSPKPEPAKSPIPEICLH